MHSDLKPLLQSLHMPIDAELDELEVLLAIDEDRSRTMLKIPRTRSIGLERLQKIELVRELLEARRTGSATLRASSSKLNDPMPLPNLEQASETVTDAGALGEIRRLLNTWASSIPHHGIHAFGNEIELHSVVKRQLYHVELKQLYEKRQLLEQAVPFRESVELSEPVEAIDPWSLIVPAPEDFSSCTTLHHLPNTRRKVCCERCAGQGAYWCNHCGATGLTVCRSCHGSRQIECKFCPAQDECSTCHNLGTTRCLDCRDGWQQCTECSGYRKLSCEDCLGAGQLLRFKVLEVVREAVEACEPLLSEELKEVFHPEPYEPEVCYQWQGSPKSVITENTELAVLIDTLSRRSSRRACGQEVLRGLCIYRSALLRVDYSYEARSYTLWIYGNRVYATTSPIHEYDQRISEAASTALQAGDYRKTLELLSSAFTHSPSSARGLVVLSQTLEALQKELQRHHYSLVIEVVDRAYLLLGPNLAVGFPPLKQQAISHIRSELSFIFLAESILAFGAIFYLLHHQGEIYARDSFTLIAPLLFLITLAIMMLAGSQLQTRLARLTVSIVALIAVSTAATLGALALQQEYVARYKQEGIFKYGDGSYEQAQAAVEPFELAAKAQTHDAELYYLLGRAARRSDQFEKAVAALERACQLEPTARNWAELGLALQGRGETTSAIEALRKAIALSQGESTYIELLAGMLSMEYYYGGKIVLDGKEIVVDAFLADREETVKRLIDAHSPQDIDALIAVRGLRGLTPLSREQRAYIEQIKGRTPPAYTCSLKLNSP